MRHELSQLKELTLALKDDLKAAVQTLHAGQRDLTDGLRTLADGQLHLTDVQRRLAMEVARLGSNMDSMERRMATTLATKDDLSLIIQRFDSVIPDIEAARRDRALSSDAYLRQERRLDDHEARLRKLEDPNA